MATVLVLIGAVSSGVKALKAAAKFPECALETTILLQSNFWIILGSGGGREFQRSSHFPSKYLRNLQDKVCSLSFFLSLLFVVECCLIAERVHFGRARS